MKKQILIIFSFLCVLSVTGFAVNLPTSGSAAANPCGTSITVNDDGGTGANYSSNADSYIVLNSSGVSTITISGAYNVENNFDYIYLYDGSGTGGTLLNFWTGKGNINYTGTCGQTLTLRFVSDVSVVKAGFSLNVTYTGACTAYPTLNIPASGNNSVTCATNTTLFDNGGSAGPYTSNNDGYTVINCTGLGQVSLCGVINIENGYDYVRIYDGTGTAGTLLATYTGLGQNISYTGAVGQTLTVRFTSDVSIVSSGFYINVTYLSCCTAMPTITATSPASRCGTGTVNLSATAVGGAATTINWYASATGGVSLGTSLGTPTTWTTPSISATTTYYAEATYGCHTASPRTAVVATITQLVSITTQPSSVTIAAGLNASFSVTASNATSYQWQVSTNGGVSFSNLTNGGVYSTVTTATMNITGATAGMTLYQYQCIVTNACGSVTSSAATLTVTSGYCAPNALTATNDYIDGVLFNTLNKQATGAGAGGYQNFSATGGVATTSLNAGSSYLITINTRQSAVSVAHGLALWIDWNQNGSADVGESTLLSNTVNNVNLLVSALIPIPSNASLGATRMRVRFIKSYAFATPPTALESCTASVGGLGETEDYTVTIIPACGNAYGIYSSDGSGISGIVDCEIKAAASSSGVGCRLCTPSETAYIGPWISTYPSVTMDNVSCTNTTLNVTTTGGGPSWVNMLQIGSGTFSTATPSAANPISGSYSATDRKTIRLTATPNSRTDHILESFETGALPTGWVAQTSSGNNWFIGSGGFAYSGNYCGQYQWNVGAAANAFLITPGIAMTAGKVYYLRFYQNCKVAGTSEKLRIKVATAATAAAQGAGTLVQDYGTISNTSYTLRTASYTAASTATYYFSFNCYSSANQYTIGVDSVSIFSFSPTVDYTDFANMMMAPPAPGSITGVNNVCPGTYSFGASAAGTPGYTYTWSVNTVSGLTPVIASATAGTTDITFTNPTGAPITYTVTLQVKSECCGNLTPVTYSVTINPQPVVPTAAAASLTPCPGSSVNLIATAPAGTFNWYDALTGGNLLTTGAILTVNPVVSGSVNYYVEAVNSNGCISTPRTIVNVNGTPTTPPTVVNGSACGAGNVTVSISSPLAGYTYNWYTGSCNGTLVQSSTSTSYTAYISATTTYYVSAIAPGGCNESACTTATATIGTPPATITWLGAVGGLNNWFNTLNWTSGCIPTCASNVIIPVTANNPDIGFNASGPAACKDLTLNGAGPVLSFSDTKAELDICGNMVHSGTLTTNNKGRVVFMGTTAQTCTRTGTGTFNDVTLNNTAATPTLTLVSNDMVLGTTGSFTFQSGKVITNALKLEIDNTDTTSMSGYAAGKYVEGNLRRYINSASVGTYDFPVGIANNGISTNCYELARVRFTSAPTTLTYLTANFNAWGGTMPATGPAASECITNTYAATAPLNNGFWQIDGSPANNTSGKYNMTLFNTAYSNSQSGWTVMSKHGAAATYGLLNEDGSASTCTAASTASATQRYNMKGFSKFATAQSLIPLPIELLTFNAVYNGTAVDVTWQTATEINNNFYTVERSTDAINFIFIGNVPSKAINGNSTVQLNYALVDPNVEAGMTYYYRLKQTDFNGTYNYSNIAIVIIDDNSIFTVHPNPTANSAEIVYNCNGNETAALKVFDDRGRLIISKDLNCSKGKNTSSFDLTDQPGGMFFVTLTVNNKVYKTKLLKASTH